MVLAERAPGARDQSLGVGQVAGPIDVHMHPQLRDRGRKMAGRTGVIEMDVRQAEMSNVAEGEPGRRGTLLQPSQARRGSWIDENELIVDQEGGADRPVEAVEPDVDDAEALAQRSSTGTKVRSRRPVKT